MFLGWHDSFNLSQLNQNVFIGQGWRAFVIVVVAVGFMEILHFIQRHGSIRHMLVKKHWLLRVIIYTSIIFSIIILGKFQNTEFIYFQF